MIEEFDKEIDALLRQTARIGSGARLESPAASIAHLDADDISAFAENALPEITKKRYTEHFAECTRCRKILTETILMNSEAEPEAASSAVGEKNGAIAVAPVPWYKRLFAMPNLAFTMGGLILVFGGMIGFLALQTMNTKDGMMTQANTAQMPRESGPSAGQNETFPSAESSSNAASSTSNATASNANAAASNTTAASTNSSAVTAPMVSNANAADKLPGGLVPASPVRRDESAADAAPQLQQAPMVYATPADETAADIDDAKKEKEEKADRAKESSPPPPPPPPPPAMSPAPSMKRSARKPEANAAGAATIDSAGAPATRSAGGKTFRRQNSTWIDGAYREGTVLRHIARGSNDYRKLDSGLRSIAESLDGAVIIVWKGKGYRIQ